MKFFDLTFSGAVLPEHDPAQVKQALARLFSIEDGAELEALFSGKTIVLRHHLDRKSAAEYFRKIAEMGAKAALVESIEPPEGETSNMRTAQKSSRTSQNRASEGPGGGCAVNSEVVKPEDFPPDLLHDTFQSIRLEQHEELCRLRTLMSQMKERSRQKYLALQTRKEAFERLADQELLSVAERANDALLRARTELAQIEASAAQLNMRAESEFNKLQLEQENHRALTLERIATLESLMQETRQKENTRAQEIEVQRKATRHAAELEIERLRQLILESQNRADVEEAQLAQDLESVVSSARLELDSLEQKRIELTNAMQQVMDSLLQQQKDVKLSQEAEADKQNQRQQELRQICMEEESRLIVQQLDIRNQRERGIEEVEKASNQLEAMTRKNLKKLYALEMQTKRRHQEMLETQENPVLFTAVNSELTLH